MVSHTRINIKQYHIQYTTDRDPKFIVLRSHLQECFWRFWRYCVRAKYVLSVLQVTFLPREPAGDDNDDDQEGDDDDEDDDEDDDDDDDEDDDDVDIENNNDNDVEIVVAKDNAFLIAGDK